jgi:Domain of unknown function (DUF4365)
MDLSQRKQEFSKAYVKAVAAVCGYATQVPSVDDDSVDLGLAARGGGGTVRSPRLDLQLKCTDQDFVRSQTINFPLPVKNYEELRPTDLMVPRILVVVVVPGDLAQWVAHSESELLLRHCGYWFSLRGMPATENEETVTLHIPRGQVFSVPAVTGMMHRISNGEFP